MKTFKIKIAGSGTHAEIVKALYELTSTLDGYKTAKLTESIDYIGVLVIEDATLFTMIEKEDE
jgi:hypothetical protein